MSEICFVFYFLRILFFFLKAGWTPLHKAAEKGFEEIVKLFIEHHANVNIQNKVFSFFFFFDVFFPYLFHFLICFFFILKLCIFVFGFWGTSLLIVS